MDEIVDELDHLNLGHPEPRQPTQNPEEEIQRWQRGERQPFGTYISPTSFSTSEIPLKELKPIKLCDMEVPKVHVGQYLVCKVVGKPIPFFGANVLIQDLDGDVEEAVIYGCRYKLDDVKWASLGTIFIIKKPWLQYTSKPKTRLRVDTPSDIIIVDPTDEELLKKIDAMKWFQPASMNAEELLEKANTAFEKANYDEALLLFDRGIRCNPDSAALYLNKALTLLKTGAFQYAYEAAKIGYEKGGDREKAFYRMGKAAYGMREWKTAAENFLKVLKEFPEHTEASEQFSLIKARINEQRNGSYDFKSILTDTKRGKREFDIADYKGPIEIAEISGKGRGIIATTDIKRGTLLTVTKAFAGGYSQDIPNDCFPVISILKEKPSNFLLDIDIMQKLNGNPQKAKEVYDLYAGEDNKIDKNEIPLGVIDATIIHKICKFNRFESAEVVFSGVKEKSWMHILPSYYNHSCLANAKEHFYGDIMIVHANKEIKKGEEICISYVDPLMEYSERSENIKTLWGFKCECLLCETDSKDEMYSERNKIFEEFENFADNTFSPNAVISKGEQVVKKIRQSYKTRNQFKTKLVQVLYLLSKMYYSVDNFTKAIERAEEAVSLTDDSLKFDLKIPILHYNLSTFYFMIGKNDKHGEMIQKAVDANFCVDEEHFKMYC